MSIMKPEDYRYTWTIPKTRWVAFFLWVYDIDKDQMTLCRFWWGNILMVLALPLRLATLPISA